MMDTMTDYEHWTEQAIEGIAMMLRAGMKRDEIVVISLFVQADDIEELITKAEERVSGRTGN